MISSLNTVKLYLLEEIELRLQPKSTSDDMELFGKLKQLFDQRTFNPENLIQINAGLEGGLLVTDGFELGTKSALAILLFPLVEFGEVDEDFIKTHFDAKVLELIIGLRQISELINDKLQLHADNFIELILSKASDVRIGLIRLSQQLIAMRNLFQASEEQQLKLATETRVLYAPMAHRLGLYNVKTELEELAMKYLNTDVYRAIAKKLNETKASRDEFITEFVAPLSETVKKYGITASIKGRPKSIHSIWTKMKAQGVPFEEVYDLFAIRIIINTPLDREKDDCWKVYSLVTQNYEPNPYRLRDWISSPKKNTGYESLHTTVIGHDGKWVEVQIRTERMDIIAEKGSAAHWRYKGGSGGDWLSQVREALENKKEDINDGDSQKAALYTSEIFIFTPEGDLKRSRAESTVLDFAYGIHSEVGSRCTGAVVNGRIASLDKVLLNGDKVKILTSKTQKPRYEWLEFVTGSRTKTKIRRAIKNEHYKSAEKGKELVRFKLNQIKKVLTDENILVLLEYFDYDSPVEMWEDFGNGTIDTALVKKAFETPKTTETPIEQAAQAVEPEEAAAEVQGRSGELLIIDKNISAIDYTLSRCCNPILGDNIFGFITINSGTKIHKRNCPNAKDMISRYPYRVINAQWNVSDLHTAFLTNIKVVGRNSLGIVNQITHLISDDLKVNMRSLNVQTTKNDEIVGNLTIMVTGTGQLDTVMGRLNKLKDVISVTRTDLV